jgi:hypothetical protein
MGTAPPHEEADEWMMRQIAANHALIGGFAVIARAMPWTYGFSTCGSMRKRSGALEFPCHEQEANGGDLVPAGWDRLL